LVALEVHPCAAVVAFGEYLDARGLSPPERRRLNHPAIAFSELNEFLGVFLSFA
jgi:hypothetical protein